MPIVWYNRVKCELRDVHPKVGILVTIAHIFILRDMILREVLLWAENIRLAD